MGYDATTGLYAHVETRNPATVYRIDITGLTSGTQIVFACDFYEDLGV